MYRKRYGQIVPDQIIEYLVLDAEFPRAIHHCLIMAELSLRNISGTMRGRFTNRAEKTLGRLLADQDQLNDVVTALGKLVPAGGTSLENAFQAALEMSPLPDNIFLITDGLPTQGATAPRGSKISGRDRMKLFERAMGLLPRSIPVNIILAPMEGDPMAASAYWQLAQLTAGSFLSPAEDWP